jgi:hypothetical protein
VSVQGWQEFLAADGVDDWVVLHGGATAVFRVQSLCEATLLAGAVAGVPGQVMAGCPRVREVGRGQRHRPARPRLDRLAARAQLRQAAAAPRSAYLPQWPGFRALGLAEAARSNLGNPSHSGLHAEAFGSTPMR